MWGEGHVALTRPTKFIPRIFEQELEKSPFSLDEVINSLGSSFSWERYIIVSETEGTMGREGEKKNEFN